MEKDEVKDVQDNCIKYNNLTPISNADDDRVYSNMLSYQLADNNINNIAITGPYGSGKSSFIKTYQNGDNNNKYINISLASFVKKADNGEKISYIGLNEIEESILQQIFYTVDADEIPLSRYKRIKEISNKSILGSFVVMLIFTVIGYYLIYYKSFSENILKLVNVDTLNTVILGIFIGILVFILYNIFRFVIMNISIFKLKFKTDLAEVELDQYSEKRDSVFDKNLDEILYFFEKTSYNIIVFEDLDRIDDIDIFIKLRELNKIINSKKNMRKVVFIYVIKDDMFSNNMDRIKFFDAIIPIIPIINSSNSNEMLNTILDKMNIKAHRLSKKFINNISIYIDDMRMLKNITNEFIIYKSKLNGLELDDEKIFSIITYKNINPKGFAQLQRGEGDLAELLNNRNKLVDDRIDKLKGKISDTLIKINDIEQESLDSIREIKSVFYSTLINYINLDENRKLIINSNTYTYRQYIEDSFNVEMLRDATIIKYNNYGHQDGYIKLDKIEENIPESKKLFYRLSLLDDKKNNKKQQLMLDLNRLNMSIDDIRSMNISQLIDKYGISMISNEILQDKFLVFLLRNGWVDENYEDYINFFYKGSLTINDKKFILSIKNQEGLDYDYQLNNVDMVINRLDEFEFNKKYSLNYKLLSYMIERNSKYNDNLIQVFLCLSDGDIKNMIFIRGFFDIAGESVLKFFIEKIVYYFPAIWNYIIEEKYTKDVQDKYLFSIIKYAQVIDIEKMFAISNIKDYIEKSNNLFYDIESSYHTDIINKFRELKVKLKDVNLYDISYGACDNLITGQCIELNYYMVKEILKNKRQSISKNQYESIVDLNDENFNNYIYSNIDEYVEKGLLVDENEYDFEDVNSLIKILNLDELSDILKIKILQRTKLNVKDLSVINKNIWQYMIKYNKVTANWNNLRYYYENNSLDENIIIYLNTEENHKCLSKQPISYESMEESFKKLIVDLLYNQSLEDKSLLNILKNINITYASIDFSKISEIRSILLIEANKITFNINNYNSLRKTYKKLIVNFIEMNINIYIKSQSEYEFDNEDLFNILNSSKITYKVKYSIFKNMSNVVCDSMEFSNKLINLFKKVQLDYKIENDLMKNILDNNSNVIDKIYIINNQFEYLDQEKLREYINNLEYPYSEIYKPNKRPLLNHNNEIEELISNLKNNNYISDFKYENGKIRVINKK